MGQVNRTRDAEEDILELALFIGRRNSRAANRMLEKIDRALDLLADFPGAGQRRDDLIPELRSFPEPPYLLFYREIAGGIELLRVLHGAQDIDRIFRQP